MNELKTELYQIGEAADSGCISENEYAIEFLNLLTKYKNELIKNNRTGYLIDIILNDEIFE